MCICPGSASKFLTTSRSSVKSSSEGCSSATSQITSTIVSSQHCSSLTAKFVITGTIAGSLCADFIFACQDKGYLDYRPEKCVVLDCSFGHRVPAVVFAKPACLIPVQNAGAMKSNHEQFTRYALEVSGQISFTNFKWCAQPFPAKRNRFFLQHFLSKESLQAAE